MLAGRWTTSERKLKCTRCGKWFKAADYKRTLCPACTAAERARKATLPPSPPRPASPPARLPTPAAPAATVAVSPPTAAAAPITASAPVAPSPAAVSGQQRAAQRRPAELTVEQRQAVEARYLALATPREFDGIRSQIAGELQVPKALVKRVVKELRLRLGRPSWWDEQRAGVAPDVVAAVRECYLPLLAGDILPPVGVHSQLAETLALTPVQVYRAIGQIRAELGLPKFNERPEAEPNEDKEPEPEPAAASSDGYGSDHVAPGIA